MKGVEFLLSRPNHPPQTFFRLRDHGGEGSPCTLVWGGRGKEAGAGESAYRIALQRVRTRGQHRNIQAAQNGPRMKEGSSIGRTADVCAADDKDADHGEC